MPLEHCEHRKRPMHGVGVVGSGFCCSGLLWQPRGGAVVMVVMVGNLWWHNVVVTSRCQN